VYGHAEGCDALTADRPAADFVHLAGVPVRAGVDDRVARSETVTHEDGSVLCRIRCCPLWQLLCDSRVAAAREAGMTTAEVTLAVFTLFNSLRFLAYVPQIAKTIKDRSGAEAISFGTWFLFLASHTSAMAYAIENQGDWKMATVFLGNAVGCVAILLIAGWKRLTHRRHAPKQAATTVPQRRQ
jgi:hypothetical protein